MELPNIGENIRKARLDKGLTQEQLATMLGTTKAAISRYESQKREPRIGQLIAIAEALGVSLAYLQGTSEETEKLIVSKLKTGEIQADDEIIVDTDGNVYLPRWDANDPSVAEKYNQRVTPKNIKKIATTIESLFNPCTDHDRDSLCKILIAYAELGMMGKVKAVERIQELAEIPKYRKTPPQD